MRARWGGDVMKDNGKRKGYIISSSPTRFLLSKNQETYTTTSTTTTSPPPLLLLLLLSLLLLQLQLTIPALSGERRAKSIHQEHQEPVTGLHHHGARKGKEEEKE